MELCRRPVQDRRGDAAHAELSAIVDRLDSADSVSDAWLADQEHNSGCLLFLWDNGAALHFAGTTGSADARNAVEPLLEEGLSPLLDTSLHDSSGAVQRQSAVFTLNEYRCHAALLPRGTAGSYLLVAALQDMALYTVMRSRQLCSMVRSGSLAHCCWRSSAGG